MEQYRLKSLSLALACTITITACGGSGGGGGEVSRELVELNSANLSLEPLKSSPSNNFATHLKNGLYTASINQTCVYCEATASSAQASDTFDSGFSQTNNQESGVDEADRIEYDGQYLFIAANAYHDPIEQNSQDDYIKIMQRQADASMEHIANIALPENFNTVNGLYLNNNTLSAIGSPMFWHTDIMFDIWHPPMEQKVNLALYDLQSPSTPSLTNSISFDGHLISSRRIDDTLYLVSSYSPTVEGMNYGAASDHQKQQNYDTIMATDINQLMPKLSVKANGEQTAQVSNLVDPQDCYIPLDASNADGYDSIVTLTAIDMSQPSNIQSVCINALTHEIYASASSLYLMGSNHQHNQSVIHRFALNDNLDYIGTGTVEGHFGWSRASFRLSEYQETLRVVTSSDSENGPLHQLYIFDTEAQDHRLNILAQLPNDNHPEPIGKPNEDIYAVRYFNDKAYIVTFERIDPLYVIDLSSPTNPQISGELEVPGFSSYLHPIGEELLLGVGQEVNNGAMPENGDEPTSTTPPIITGVQIALFDVSDSSNPQQISLLSYSDSYSPIEWDHHALSYLAMDNNQHRFTLPITSWSENEQGMWLPNSRLKLLEVIDNGGVSELVENSEILAPQNHQDYYYIDSAQDRAIIHADDVYYIHGNDVIKSNFN